MNLSSEEIVIAAIVVFMLLVAVCFIFIELREVKRLKTVTKPHRGTKTERKLVLTLLKYGVPPQSIFHDLYVEKQDGTYAQLDLVVVTKAGIVVVEVKDYSGWIFGSSAQLHWTQVLAYGKQKYRFYNPIRQNSSHIAALKKQLGQLKHLPFYSVIVFYGNCVLKKIDTIPPRTFLVKPHKIIHALSTIISNNEPVSYPNKENVVSTLQQAVLNGSNKEIRVQHIRNIKETLQKHSR